MWKCIGSRVLAIAILAATVLAAPAADEKSSATALSPDQKIQAQSDGATIRVVDVATGKDILAIKGHTEKITSLAFSPDGKLLASGSADKSVRLWELASGKAVRKIQCKNGVTLVSFSQDGKNISARESDNTIHVWDLATGKEK